MWMPSILKPFRLDFFNWKGKLSGEVCLDPIHFCLSRSSNPQMPLQNTSALTPVSSSNSAARRHTQYGLWKLSPTHQPDSLILLLTKRKFLSTQLNQLNWCSLGVLMLTLYQRRRRIVKTSMRIN
jgi:hypothetical protein